MNDVHLSPGSPATSQRTITHSPWRKVLTRRGLIVVAMPVALFLIARLVTHGAGKDARGHRNTTEGAVPIAAAPVQEGDMPVVMKALGTVTPLATVTVQSQISGQIVKRGDSLIQIDPRPYQVALEQAQGALERDRAELANAKIDLVRYQTLYSQDSIPEQQLATQKALVAQYEGTVHLLAGYVRQPGVPCPVYRCVSNIGCMRDDDTYGADLFRDYPRRFPCAKQLGGSPWLK